MTTIDTPRRSRGFARGALGRSWSGVVVLLLFYVALLVAFSLLSPWFLSFNNMMSIGSNVAFIGLMAATGTPLIIAGGLDLSVAAVAGLTGVVLALLHGAGLDIWVAAVAAVLCGAAIGLVNGIFTTGLRLNPLIVTLATMSIITGSALVMTGGLTRPLMVPGFNWIGSGRLFGVPVPLIVMLLCYGALWVVLAKSRFGRFVYASGGNPEASRLVGVPVARTQITLYVLSGISGAVAGLVLAAMLGAAAPDAAGKHLLTVIAAIILGGTSLFGGRGTMIGTVLGALTVAVIGNGLILAHMSPFLTPIITGVIILIAIWLNFRIFRTTTRR